MALIQPSSFWRKASPRGAIADFRNVFREAGNNRWRFALLSAAMTIGIFSIMVQEEQRGLPRPPKVTYITTLPEGRSDAEIMAENKANQILQDRLAAEQAKREAEVRDIYRKIGRYSGMDVDAIEKKAAADEKAKAATAPGSPKGE